MAEGYTEPPDPKDRVPDYDPSRHYVYDQYGRMIHRIAEGGRSTQESRDRPLNIWESRPLFESYRERSGFYTPRYPEVYARQVRATRQQTRSGEIPSRVPDRTRTASGRAFIAQMSNDPSVPRNRTGYDWGDYEDRMFLRQHLSAAGVEPREHRDHSRKNIRRAEARERKMKESLAEHYNRVAGIPDPRLIPQSRKARIEYFSKFQSLNDDPNRGRPAGIPAIREPVHEIIVQSRDPKTGYPDTNQLRDYGYGSDNIAFDSQSRIEEIYDSLPGNQQRRAKQLTDNIRSRKMVEYPEMLISDLPQLRRPPPRNVGPPTHFSPPERYIDPLTISNPSTNRPMAGDLGEHNRPVSQMGMPLHGPIPERLTPSERSIGIRHEARAIGAPDYQRIAKNPLPPRLANQRSNVDFLRDLGFHRTISAMPHHGGVNRFIHSARRLQESRQRSRMPSIIPGVSDRYPIDVIEEEKEY